MLDQQPVSFQNVYSTEQCLAQFNNNNDVLTTAVCTKLSQYDVIFGAGTYSNSGSSDGCPAPATTAGDASTGQAVNRLNHCCSAEAAADKCPVWANDSLWAGTTNAPSPNGTSFATNTGNEATDWAYVTSGASRFEKTNVEAVLYAWFSQLPVDSSALTGLVIKYTEDFRSGNGAAFATAANGTDGSTGEGCNYSAAATLNVQTWVDCMNCTAGGSPLSATNLYTAPTDYTDSEECQGTVAEGDQQQTGGNESGEDSGEESGETESGDDGDEVSCPKGCKSSVLKTLGMSVIFAFIVNMMN